MGDLDFVPPFTAGWLRQLRLETRLPLSVPVEKIVDVFTVYYV